MGIFSSQKPRVLNEAYFGKVPKVVRIEKVIAELKAKYDGDIYNPKISVDPLWRKLGDAIYDGFGLRPIFDIFNDPMWNMATIPIGMAFDVALKEDIRKYIIVDKEGYRYDKKAGYMVCFLIYTGLFFDKLTNTKEVTAILLHEIGHNFTPSAIPVGALDRLFTISQFIAYIGMGIIAITSSSTFITSLFASSTVIMFLSSNAGKKFCKDLDDYLRKKFPSSYYYSMYIDSVFKGYQGLINDFLGTYSFIQLPFVVIQRFSNVFLGQLRHIGMSGIAMPVTKIRQLTLGYTDESFADSFPTMYGYGPDLASAFDNHSFGGELGSSSITQEVKKVCPLYTNFYDLVILPFVILIEAFDEHPSLASRYLVIKKNLEYNLNKNKTIREEDKKRIRNDLQRLQKTIDNLTKINAKSPFKDRAMITKLYYAFIYHIMGGDIKSRVYTGAQGEYIDAQIEKIKKLEFK